MPENGARTEGVGHRTVTVADIASFGSMTGDYARMHFDHHEGARSPIGGTIAHGLLGACWSIGMLTRLHPQCAGVGDPGAVVSAASFRFRHTVRLGDTLALRLDEREGERSRFSLLTHEAAVATTGEIQCTRTALPEAPAAWRLEPWERPEGIHYAEDMPECGPRGEALGRTIGAADVVPFANAVGETNPLYLNEPFAARARFGARSAPPMLCFCLAFSDFLSALLSMSLPSRGFAGHVGDRWQLYAPVLLGDTIRARYRTLSFRPSSSRPGMGLVEFGLQLLNQHDEVVQAGAATMMMARRPA